MKAKGFPLARVAAVSGSGQQHGSAYWKAGALAKLRGLKAGTPLVTQLAGAFSIQESPIWMDSSTTEQCRALGAWVWARGWGRPCASWGRRATRSRGALDGPPVFMCTPDRHVLSSLRHPLVPSHPS